MERRSAIFSVKPELAAALVAGTKKFEFRRVRPALNPGDRVYVYSTAPAQAIIGDFQCGEIYEGTPESVWRRLGRNAGTPRAIFKEYFAASDRAYAIGVIEPSAWSTQLSLATIRRSIRNFHPPRSYIFLAPKDRLTQLIARFSRNGAPNPGSHQTRDQRR